MTIQIETEKIGSKALLIRIPHALAKAIKHLAVEKDQSIQDIAIEAFKDILKKYKEKGKKDLFDFK